MGYERLCEQLNKRLGFPVTVMTELSPTSQGLFAQWVEKLKKI
jgi:hypothetical protein